MPATFHADPLGRFAIFVLFAGLLGAPCAVGGAAHSGNVYLVGDDVRVTVPPTWKGWRAIDLDGKEVGRGSVRDGAAELGKLPIGYFEVWDQGGTERITAGVLAKSAAVEDTPIALDAAMSWLYSDPEQIRGACRLAQLAGVRWVRDRSSWPELQPERGRWAGQSRYERAMRIQRDAGLKVLQVNHASPPWAAKNGSRFPEDLSLVHAFYEGVARRWLELADAVEPWNEPDIELFGGHTGCEIASFHKAAYWGLKAGNPDQPICGTVFAIDREETLDEFAANEAYPYFDRYGLHHYIRLNEYPRAYGRHRAVSGGRPMWTTELNLPVVWADEKTKEPSEEELRFQAYRVGKVMALVIHEGAEKAFYFILGDYVERNLQYGLVHKDLTPRPAYVAFAAVGRLMNGAKPRGRIDLGDEKLKAYAFRTQVDGVERETVVAWSETSPTTVEFPTAEQGYDVLGRDLAYPKKLELTRSTVYLVLPPGGSKPLKIQAPPARPQRLEATPCPVVLQLIGQGDFKQSAFQLTEKRQLRLVAYNFTKRSVRGTLRIEGGRPLSGGDEMEIQGSRSVRTVVVDGAGPLTVRLDLGEIGQAVVSARVLAPPATAPTTAETGK